MKYVQKHFWKDVRSKFSCVRLCERAHVHSIEENIVCIYYFFSVINITIVIIIVSIFI